MTEADIHRAVAVYLQTVLDPRQVWWSTFPSGGGGQIRGALLKSMGLKAGVPDILVIPARKPAHWIELKAEGKYLEPHQRALHASLEGLGCKVSVCRSIDDVRETFAEWGIPTKEAV